MSNASCVVLAPMGGTIEPQCEHGLRALESRGYPVRRVYGIAQIDFCRCVMASEAFADGFQEFMWIDSDIGFDPDAVDRLRRHNLPLVCAIYAKKGVPEFACDFTPNTDRITFGEGGGLFELRNVGFGFVHFRRVVLETMRDRLALPLCNAGLGLPMYPFFLPMVVNDPTGPIYLGEDYAFCERARQCGIKIMADTTIRLAHLGRFAYTWDTVAPDRPRRPTLHVNLHRKAIEP